MIFNGKVFSIEQRPQFYTDTIRVGVDLGDRIVIYKTVVPHKRFQVEELVQVSVDSEHRIVEIIKEEPGGMDSTCFSFLVRGWK